MIQQHKHGAARSEADAEVDVAKRSELQQHEQHREQAHQNGEEGQRERQIVHGAGGLPHNG